MVLRGGTPSDCGADPNSYRATVADEAVQKSAERHP
jgi:hypothetical protein